ncbi:retinol dehydrogenase 12 isoform X1 [Tribolium castaneum]|uniref:WW domain-containing oxidoreductase-like Protein n=1 Tax=Tribolium castaneum TaxID=7070 RepID=D6X004_TRICA|nr:PREDICTED: retinol dehydrogenase 12 isoform X1 [Tribolium castaneum]EFA09614.2 WW domain-containing oxidoreductase-like Protein [Tribolium castaneum]|eukprot:XP_975173.1 PREDICTED: retinol dehydrogenase 12 isoform X1 [Tribolium castaneum]
MLALLCALFFVYFALHRLTIARTKSATCLVGKTAIVTGANSGIGYQTALNLASRGCRVIMADVSDLTQSRNNVIKFTSNSNIIAKKIDLGSLQSVREFASDIAKSEPRLDILINNAGISSSKSNRTGDGLHPVMQINYFGHFLLTHLLIDLLKKSAPSRIVFTSSFMSFFHNLTLTNLNYDADNGFASAAKIYCNSKLAQMIASDIFAAKLKGTGVTSNSINPGIVNTTLLAQFFTVQTQLKPLQLITDLYLRFVAKDAWEGSQVIVHCAVSKKLEGVSGRYFWNCVPVFKPLQAQDGEFCRKIWGETERLVKLAPEERL